MNIVIFGAPGAGKGTQSSFLVDRRDMFHISTGDLLREAIKEQTELGQKAKGYMDRGELVPDDIVLGMVEEVFPKIGEKKFILDGFPRTAAQAEGLELMLEKNQRKIDRAVFLHVPDQLLMERLTGRRICRSCGAVYHLQGKRPAKDGVCDKCGSTDLYQRDDDKEEVIENRLKAYMKSTAPLVSYYKDSGQYTEVDGVGEAEDIYRRIEQILDGGSE